MKNGLVIIGLASVLMGVCYSNASVEQAIKAGEEAVEWRIKQLAFERQQSEKWHMEEGARLFRLGDYEGAVDELRTVLELNPENAEARKLLNKAESALERKRAEEERIRAERVQVELKGHINRAQKYLDEGEYLKAMSEAEKALVLQPENEKAAQIWQKANANIGQAEEQELEKLREEQAQKYLKAGEELLNKGLYDDAIAELEKVLAIMPKGNPKYLQAEDYIYQAKMAKLGEESAALRAEHPANILKKELEVASKWDITKEEKAPPEKTPETEQVEEEAKKFEEKLMTPIESMKFENAHLRVVLKFLSDIGGVNIVLDESIFQPEETMTAETPVGAYPSAAGYNVPEYTKPTTYYGERQYISPYVNIDIVTRTPLIDVLKSILAQKGLAFKKEKNAIWITTPEVMKKQALQTRVYRLPRSLAVQFGKGSAGTSGTGTRSYPTVRR